MANKKNNKVLTSEQEKMISSIKSKLSDEEFNERIQSVLDEVIDCKTEDEDYLFDIVDDVFDKLVNTNEFRCKIREKLRVKIEKDMDTMIEGFVDDVCLSHD